MKPAALPIPIVSRIVSRVEKKLAKTVQTGHFPRVTILHKTL